MTVPLDLTAVGPALSRLQHIETNLAATLIERDEAVHTAIVALLTRQHLAVIGKPGTAKSALVTGLAQRIAPPTGGGLRTFIWLLTKFTTPEELFGPISVKGLKADEYRRITTGKLPEAELCYLDEIFKASSSVLNALLSILNERVFDNGPSRITVPLLSCFGSSNELPQGEDLAALWDRFGLRIMVDYVSDTEFPRMLRLAAIATPPPTLPATDLEALQQTVTTIPVPESIMEALAELRKNLSGKGMFASDRRWRQCLPLLQASALLEGRGLVEEDDLLILKHALWMTPDQCQEIGRLAARLANPLNARAVELGDQADTVHVATMQAQRGAATDEAKMQAAVEGASKLKAIVGQLTTLREQADAHGRSTTRIERVAGQVADMRRQVAELVL